MRAVIDVGSNASRLLAGEMKNGVFVSHLFSRVPVALGRDSYGATKTVAAPARKRLILALSGLHNIAKAMDAKSCAVFATAAVRDCRNRRALVSEVQRKTGLELRVLSGGEEAEVIGEFVARQFAARAVLNTDTGGGSTDCALVLRGKIQSHATFPIGTARKNGGAAAEKKKMTAWLKEHGKGALITASGGGARKMQTICGSITAANVEKLMMRAETMSAPRRAKVFDLTPDRARTILPAARIGLLILRATGAKKLHPVQGGLGEAMLTRILTGKD